MQPLLWPNIAPRFTIEIVKPSFLKTTLATAAFVLTASVSMAGLQEGLDAWSKGDFKTALAEWRPLAKQGDANAQYNLGLMYDNGQGVAQDYKMAVHWYSLAAKQGLAQAQNNLGVAYEFGVGLLQSNIMAHMWYNISSANGAKKATGRRDKLVLKMTATDVSEAQRRAQSCLSSNYETCK